MSNGANNSAPSSVSPDANGQMPLTAPSISASSSPGLIHRDISSPQEWRRLARAVEALQVAGMFDVAWKDRIERVLLGRHGPAIIADVIEAVLSEAGRG